MKKLLEFSKVNKPIITSELKSFLDKKVKEDKSDIPFYKTSINKLADFAVNGKMLRGLLVLLTCEMFSKEDNKQALKAAVAVELIHSALLIQDDIIDKDFTRRGRKTIFAQFQNEADNSVEDKLFYGQSIAICVADVAIFLALELLSESNNSEVINIVSREIQRVAAAEMLDFHWGSINDEPNSKEILNMYKNKSARYTFSLPLKLGALIAGRSNGTVEELEKLGENLGIVFQIKDDEIGLLGDEMEIGKPVGSDIRQNKKTLFRALLYQKITTREKEILNEIFGNNHVTHTDIEKVKELIEKYKVKERTDKMVQDLSQKAHENLKRVNVPENYREIFEELIEYNLTRAS
ncbi:MAG TPA: polyprenyl synthetase family protein [Patescibacteria group bacterium]|nr:polyprenyl synthetase family protein [Patescibacteria group bacterium]